MFQQLILLACEIHGVLKRHAIASYKERNRLKPVGCVRLWLTLETFVDLFGGDLVALKDNPVVRAQVVSTNWMCAMLSKVMRNAHRYIDSDGTCMFLKQPIRVSLRRRLSSQSFDHMECAKCLTDGEYQGSVPCSPVVSPRVKFACSAEGKRTGTPLVPRETLRRRVMFLSFPGGNLSGV